MLSERRTPSWTPTSGEEPPDNDQLVCLSSREERDSHDPQFLASMNRQKVNPDPLLPAGSASTFAGAHDHFDADGYRASQPGCGYLDDDPAFGRPYPIPAGIGFISWVPEPTPTEAGTQTDMLPAPAPSYSRLPQSNNDARVRALEQTCARLQSDLTTVIARMQVLEINHELAVNLGDARLADRLPPDGRPDASISIVEQPFTDIAAGERASLGSRSDQSGTDSVRISPLTSDRYDTASADDSDENHADAAPTSSTAVEHA